MHLTRVMKTKLTFSLLRATASAGLLASILVGAWGCGTTIVSTPEVDGNRVRELREALAKGAGASESGGEAAPVEVGVGWGTLKGRFVVDGAVPPRAKMNVNKDVEVCAANEESTLSPQLIVASDGSLANVLVYARAVNRVHDAAKPEAFTTPFEFDQRDCMFLRHVSCVVTGQPVRILNSDQVGHNTRIVGRKNPEFNSNVPTGGELSYSAKQEENSPMSVSCSIHPWMNAYLMPRSNGYFAVSGADGSFEIANLPAGEKVEIQIWHEAVKAWGSMESVKANGRFELRLEDGGEQSLEFKVPAANFKL